MGGRVIESNVADTAVIFTAALVTAFPCSTSAVTVTWIFCLSHIHELKSLVTVLTRVGAFAGSKDGTPTDGTGAIRKRDKVRKILALFAV